MAALRLVYLFGGVGWARTGGRVVLMVMLTLPTRRQWAAQALEEAAAVG